MRGIGHTLSRLPAARALLAGAAILAGASAGDAHAQPAAAAHPAAASGLVALSRPLSGADAARVRRIFRMQAHGNLTGAARETARLDSGLLLGSILADRYLGRFHRAGAAELAAWLDRYADLPEAAAIHALLLRRLPQGTEPPPAPAAVALAPDAPADTIPEQTEDAAPGIARNPALDRTLAERARSGDVRAAQRLLASTKGLDAAYDSLLRAELAQSLFAQNRDREALRIGRRALRPCTKDGGRIGLAGYVAGLAAWRLDRHDLALTLFETAAEASIAPPSLRAAAAYWAARAHLWADDAAGYVSWLSRAAAAPQSFYGLLARHTLGLTRGFAWAQESLTAPDVDAVATTAHGRRAFALLQADQPARAEAELRLLRRRIEAEPAFGRAVMLAAGAAGLTDLAAQLAALVPTADGRPRDVQRFRVPVLRPRDGFRVDPALIYALARLESNFDSTAVSPMGARGLLQIMPVTAGYIGDDPSLASRGFDRLHDASLNLELGQRYVAYLARQQMVEGDLIRLLASYNAGPGSVARWSAEIRDQGDPLLFVEAIPNAETRAFVQHVLAYTWIYAARLRLPAPSLDELAAGAFPRFTQLDNPMTLTAASLLRQ